LTVGFPECKPLSRSTADYTDSDSTLRITKPPQAWMCQYIETAQPLSKESHQMSKAFGFRRYIGIRPGHNNYPSLLWASQQFLWRIISLCCWQTCLRLAYTKTNGRVMCDRLSGTALEGSGGALWEAIFRDIPWKTVCIRTGHLLIVITELHRSTIL